MIEQKGKTKEQSKSYLYLLIPHLGSKEVKVQSKIQIMQSLAHRVEEGDKPIFSITSDSQSVTQRVVKTTIVRTNHTNKKE